VTATNRATDAEARGDKQEAAYWRAVQATVDAAPPLSPLQCDALRVLLRDSSRKLPTRPRKGRPRSPLSTEQGLAATALPAAA